MALQIQQLRSISALSLSALRVVHAKQSLVASNDDGDDDAVTLFNGKFLSICERDKINQVKFYRAFNKINNRGGNEN